MIEQTCGQEMAASAEVPLQWQGLTHDNVAGNMDAHATWVGTATPAAKQEHDALRLGRHRVSRDGVGGRQRSAGHARHEGFAGGTA